MSWRFRKSVKIIPGVRLNISKGGFSTSIGGRGATMNIGRKGVRTTVGIPGSGLSHSTFHPHAGGTVAGGSLGGLGKLAKGFVVLTVAIMGFCLLAGVLAALNAPANPALPTFERYRVTANDVRCRKEANAKAPVVKVLRAGEVVRELHHGAGWSDIGACHVSQAFLAKL